MIPNTTQNTLALLCRLIYTQREESRRAATDRAAVYGQIGKESARPLGRTNERMQIGVIEVPTRRELFVRKMEEQILSGKLKVGDSLPSERQLQEETRISKTVIHAGLAELEQKGFLEITPRRGAVLPSSAGHSL